jgi:PST family polysaccharide transporter
VPRLRRQGYDYFSRFDTSDIGRTTMRGGGVTIAGQVAKLGISLVTLAVMARILTPADYGIFAILLILANLIGVFSDFGLSAAVIQRPSLNRYEANSLFWVNVVVGLALGVCCVALAPVFVTLFDQEQLRWAIPAMGLTFVCGGIAAQHMALMRRALRFMKLAVADVGSQIVGAVAGVSAAVAGAGYWALVVMQIAIAASQMVFVSVLSNWHPTKPRRPLAVSHFLRFGGTLTSWKVANYLIRTSDNILIGYRWGPTELGIYSRAYSLLLQPLNQIVYPIGNVMMPALSRIGGDEPDRYRRAFRSACGKMALVTMPITVFAVVNADAIVAIVLGDQWSESATVFAILGIAAIIEPVDVATGWLLVSQGRTRDILVTGVVLLPVIFIAFLIGLPYGAVGVAVAYTAVTLLGVPPLFWFVGRRGPVGAVDLYTVCGLGAVVAIPVAAAAVGGRLAVGAGSPVLQIAASGAASILAACAAVALVPSLRRQVSELHVAVRRSLGRGRDEAAGADGDDAAAASPGAVRRRTGDDEPHAPGLGPRTPPSDE